MSEQPDKTPSMNDPSKEEFDRVHSEIEAERKSGQHHRINEARQAKEAAIKEEFQQKKREAQDRFIEQTAKCQTESEQHIEQKLKSLRDMGYEIICRVKYHTLDSGRSVPVLERVSKTDSTLCEKLYRLDAGELNKGEFWVLRYYDEQGIWRLVDEPQEREFATPADFLNHVLGQCRECDDGSQESLSGGVLAKLGKAIEISLQDAHPTQKLKAEDFVRNGHGRASCVPCLDSEHMESIQLAFQAGVSFEWDEINYRGVMDYARHAAGLDGVKKQKKEAWKQFVLGLRDQKTEIAVREIVDSLVEEGYLQSRHPEGIKLVTSEDFENLKSATDEDKTLWKKKPYQWRDQKHKDGKNWLSRWKDGAQGKDENWLSYEAVRKRVNRLINPK